MSEQSSGGSNASLKQLRLGLKVAAKNWLLLLLLPGLAYGYARFVTHKQLDMFGAQTEILLEQKDEYDKAREIMEGVVSRRFQRQGPDIANQIRVLKSRDLVAKAVGDLDHNITYFIVGRVRSLPVGGLSGVEVQAFPDQFSSAALGANFDLKVLDDQTYALTVNLGGDRVYTAEHAFGEEVQTGDFRIVINRAENGRGTIEQAIAQGQRFQVRNDNQIIGQYRSGLSVRGVGQTSILKLQISNILPDRAIEFLDALSVRYIEYSTAAREAVNRKTDEFLEQQLLKIEANVDSLQDIIDQQREEAKVLDLTRNETVYFQELVQVETQREELRLKLRSLTSLESYLSRGVENTSIPPSAFLTQDPVAAEQVGNSMTCSCSAPRCCSTSPQAASRSSDSTPCCRPPA